MNTEPIKFPITESMLRAAQTENEAFTGAQYRVLGVKFGTPFKQLIGRLITAEQYQQFFDARTIYQSKKRTARERTRIIDFANL